MKTVELNGKIRERVGKSGSKAIRREGNIPAVLYGGEKTDARHLVVNEVEMEKILGSPDTFIIKLGMDGDNVDALIREIQFHPVTDKIEHVDFIDVSTDQEVDVDLPVVLTGSAKGVFAGGKLVHLMRKIRVKGKPSKLPETVSIDITNLEMGKTIIVKDVEIEGLQIVSPADAGIAAIEIPRSLRGGKTGAAAEEEEAAEGGEE